VDKDISFRMEIRGLIASFQRFHLRENHAEESALIKEIKSPEAIRGEQNLAEFVADPLRADRMNLGSQLKEGAPGSRINGESESGCEADGTEQAELILGKALGGIANGPDEMILKIISSSHIIEYLLLDRVIEEAVDGEIPSVRITFGIGVVDALGMASVVVGTISPEGGHLKLGAPLQHQNHAKLSSDGYRSGKKGLYLLRARAGCHVVVVGFQAEEPVTDTAACIECLIPLGTEALHDRSCGGFTHNHIVPRSQYLGQDGKKLTGMKR
jgi:hypothetical protein